MLEDVATICLSFNMTKDQARKLDKRLYRAHLIAAHNVLQRYSGLR